MSTPALVAFFAREEWKPPLPDLTLHFAQQLITRISKALGEDLLTAPCLKGRVWLGIDFDETLFANPFRACFLMTASGSQCLHHTLLFDSHKHRWSKQLLWSEKSAILHRHAFCREQKELTEMCWIQVLEFLCVKCGIKLFGITSRRPNQIVNTLALLDELQVRKWFLPPYAAFEDIETKNKIASNKKENENQNQNQNEKDKDKDKESETKKENQEKENETKKENQETEKEKESVLLDEWEFAEEPSPSSEAVCYQGILWTNAINKGKTLLKFFPHLAPLGSKPDHIFVVDDLVENVFALYNETQELWDRYACKLYCLLYTMPPQSHWYKGSMQFPQFVPTTKKDIEQQTQALFVPVICPNAPKIKRRPTKKHTFKKKHEKTVMQSLTPSQIDFQMQLFSERGLIVDDTTVKQIIPP